MALFVGHTVPGIILFWLGTWWMCNVWKRYFLARKAAANGRSASHVGSISCDVRYTSAASFPCPCFPSIPLEGIIKTSIIPFGMIGEILTGFNANGSFNYHNLQHLTMYFFFGLNGVLDILTFYEFPIPNGSDYASAALGFSMEALLFFFHLHGRYQVDVQMHKLLLYAVLWCLATTVAEAAKRHCVLVALAKSYFVILQGTWLIQIAILLYWPSGTRWMTNSHNDVMKVTVMFCWHSAAIFVGTVIVGMFIFRSMKRSCSPPGYLELPPLEKPLDHSYGLLDTEEGEESD